MYRGISLCFAALSVAAAFAFWPQYLSKLPRGIDGHTHLHAALMTLWLALLVAQPLLIQRGRRALHRALGSASYLLVPAIVVASLRLTHFRARSMPEVLLATEGRFFFLPLAMIALFAASWLLAMLWRSTPALHARFMLGTALALVDPVLGRIAFFYFPPLPDPAYYPALTFAVTALVLLALMVGERGARHGRAAAPALLALFGLAHTLWFTVAQQPGFVAFVRWFRALPLT